MPDPVEFELVSTKMLETILDTEDDRQKQALRDAAASRDGVLAHDAENNRFEIIDDDDLLAALDNAKGSDLLRRTADVLLEAELPEEDAEELALVSTQMLKQILGDDEVSLSTEGELTVDAGSGLDPYNSG
jgi:hypothetical protein